MQNKGRQNGLKSRKINQFQCGKRQNLQKGHSQVFGNCPSSTGYASDLYTGGVAGEHEATRPPLSFKTIFVIRTDSLSFLGELKTRCPKARIGHLRWCIGALWQLVIKSDLVRLITDFLQSEEANKKYRFQKM